MKQKAWIISVNMGYGHQRTAFALRDLALGGRFINANDYDGIPKSDRNIWESMRKTYEFISSFKRVPLIGNFIFSIMDYFLQIMSFYPERDLSRSNLQLKVIYYFIRKGWGRHLIENCKLQNPDLPIITTFFTPAFMAELFNYPGEIFCVVCDADIARPWAPLVPKTSKIKYFAPTERVVERLKLYGVRTENIFLTGYPLPAENSGGESLEILKKDLRYRLLNLDPEKQFFEKYKVIVEEKLGSLPEKADHPLTLLFAVGGAGAQKEIVVKIMRNLSAEIKRGKIRLVPVAGIREKIKKYFEESAKKLGLEIEIIYGKTIYDYFEKFNLALRKTDILWTKPSELSFFTALGLPIIIAPTIGSQEESNKRWLLKSSFGHLQENPDYTTEWLSDWLEQGYLAESAFEGFVEAEKMGTLKIRKIACGC